MYIFLYRNGLHYVEAQLKGCFLRTLMKGSSSSKIRPLNLFIKYVAWKTLQDNQVHLRSLNDQNSLSS